MGCSEASRHRGEQGVVALARARKEDRDRPSEEEAPAYLVKQQSAAVSRLRALQGADGRP